MGRKKIVPFDQIHRSGRVRRLRPLAKTVLQRFYGISASKIKPLSQSTHKFVLRVDTPDRERYVLRIHLPENGNYESNPSTPEILSELQWLLALQQGTNTEIPEIVPTREGAYLVQVPAEYTPENVPLDLRCVLFRWLPGKVLGPLYSKHAQLREPLTASEVERIGAFMAQMHLCAETYKPPEGFTRRCIDHQSEISPRSVFVIGDAEMRPVFTAEQWAAFPKAVEQIRSVMDELGKGPKAFGLVHARLTQPHLLLYRGKVVRAINFSQCGWGHYLYDISVFLVNLNEQHGVRVGLLHDAFFKGYEGLRALPAIAEKQVRIFMAIEFAQNILRSLKWGIDSIYQMYFDFELHHLADNMIYFAGV